VDTRLSASFHRTAQWMRLRVAQGMRSCLVTLLLIKITLPWPVDAGSDDRSGQHSSPGPGRDAQRVLIDDSDLVIVGGRGIDSPQRGEGQHPMDTGHIRDRGHPPGLLR